MSLGKSTPKRTAIIRHAWGDTRDIMSVLMDVVNKDHLVGQVRGFAKQYDSKTVDGQYAKLKKLWHWVRHEVRYQEDPVGTQDIKHPYRTYAERKTGTADCKSKTVFIYFVCRALDIPCFIRFVSYWDDKAVVFEKSRGNQVDYGQIGHVYPVAVLGGQTVVLDAVHTQFDSEVRPVRVVDKFPEVYSDTQIRRLAKEAKQHAIGSAASGDPQWVSISVAALSLINTVRSENIYEKLFSGAITAYLIKKALQNDTN